MSKSKSVPNSRLTDRIINGIVTSAWLWGTAVTFVFYAALPFAPIYQESISRYFTAHWIEYATTGLFFIGIATLLMKATRIPAERSALTADLLDGLKLDESLDAVGTAQGIGRARPAQPGDIDARIASRHAAGDGGRPWRNGAARQRTRSIRPRRWKPA